MAVATAGLAGAQASAAPATAPSGGVPGAGEWPFAGQNLANTHSSPNEHKISTANASTLQPKWTVTTAGNVTATPTVFGGIVYFSDQGGMLWAVNAETGSVVWSRAVSDLTGVAGDVSRPSPAISGNLLITGDGWINGPGLTGGAKIFAVNRLTGKLVWSTKVSDHPASTITEAPVVFHGVVYVGVASKEEAISGNPAYQCCTFRGAVVALDEHTGRILWKSYMIPSNNGGSDVNLPGGYSGDAVWGSSAVIDERRGLLYVGTGNNYTVPDGVCEVPGQTDCQPSAADNHTESIMALRLRDGKVQWATRTTDADVFSGACLGTPQCGPDFDFGSGPNMFTTHDPATGKPRQLIGIGQKSGIYWALDPNTGKVVWTTMVGPGSFLGGLEWGSATDGKRIYVAEADALRIPYTLGGSGPFAGQTTTGGSWAALDPATGKVLWQTPDPATQLDVAFTTVANGVMYGASTNTNGDNMFAIDAATGSILWSFDADGSITSGPAVVNGNVYWGSGYSFGPAGNSTKFYAFAPAQ
ncbi:MAG: PQQ-binding-like beta-propeller repeat protein [Micromonosporaceae bacterium]|nr:PQQ-binding-like beta-propeller repeat protein [Micromonosporaceae bacterium]